MNYKKQVIQSNRIPEIDLLRGVALFGILIVNVWLFSSSFIGNDHWRNNFSPFLDLLLEKLSAILAEQRFVGIFSLLFGIGIAIQRANFETIAAFRSYYFKRTFVLALLGILNVLFFFWGDILFIYSILSIILYSMLRFSNKVLVIISLVIFFIPVFLAMFPSFRYFIFQYEDGIKMYYTPESLTATYQSGSLAELMTARIREYLTYNTFNIFWERTALFLMLLGYAVGRNNLHITYLTYWSKMKIAFILFFLYCAVFITVNYNGVRELFPVPVFLLLYNVFIAASIYSIIFMVLWVHKKAFFPRQSLIMNVGKLSLSNYFLQSVICSFIFTSYGLSLYFKTSPSSNLMIGIGIYVVQIIISHFYLKKFKTGPLEFLLRNYTIKTTNFK